MIQLTVDEIIILHNKLLKKTGGFPGIRDIGLLESAVYSCLQSFGEDEVYPTPAERSARLAFAITQNHPFYDGNKRVGYVDDSESKRARYFIYSRGADFIRVVGCGWIYEIP